LIAPECFPNASFQPVAGYRSLDDGSLDRPGKATLPASIGQCLNKKTLTLKAFALFEQPLEISPSREPLRASESLPGQLRNEVPPALLSSFPKHAPAALARHALPESMLALAFGVGLECELFLHARIVSPHHLQRPAIRTDGWTASSEA